jgi:hypothetical protein
MSDGFHWARLLGFVTGRVSQELLLRNEYLAAENRILRAHLSSEFACRMRSDPPSALANLGYQISDRTVGNILRRHNIEPAPERSRATTWNEFIRSHMDVLAGVDFFTVEVLTWRGLVTYYVLFFIEVGSRAYRWLG